MSLCATCGVPLADDRELCPHHACVYGDDWAASNRMWCELIHRGKAFPRPAPDDDPWLELLRTAPWDEV